MDELDAYCRAVEAYLCRKNDGHLIRIVGPAFEQVTAWARSGIPLNVACAGIDRYFERYYRKGARRRPVRIEFCDADVQDAFDAWRRAVGVAAGGPVDGAGAESAGERRRDSLSAHVERLVARLTARRVSTTDASLAAALERVVRALDLILPETRRARGDRREALVAALDDLDRELMEAARAAVSDDERRAAARDAAASLAPFRDRMPQDDFARAIRAAEDQQVRDRLRLPTLSF